MIKQQLQSDMKEAMKQGNSKTVEVLRMALASINAREKEKRYKLSKDFPGLDEKGLLQKSALEDGEVINVLSSEIKKRKDAILLYEQGGRFELAVGEKGEIAILQPYLPEQLSEDDLKKRIEASIEKIGATQIKDMGKVMADLMPSIQGRADSTVVSGIVKSLLTKKS